MLKAKLVLNWTGPYKILAVDLCSAAEISDGLPLRSNLLYLDLPSDLLSHRFRGEESYIRLSLGSNCSTFCK